MSLIKNDARAAIPPEYSLDDPRNPNNLMNASHSQLEQIAADSVFDFKQKKSLRCKLQEGFRIQAQQKQIEPYQVTAALSIFALLTVVIVGRLKIQ
jgi:hypothetical protein